MKQQKNVKLLSFFGALIGLTFIIQSCGSSETDSLEQEAVDNAKEIFQNLPEMKEEIDEHKEKVNAREITGTFTGEVDGESFEFSTWEAQKSRITFLDFKALVYAVINDKPMESLRIEFMDNNWDKMDFPAEVPASYVGADEGFLKVLYAKQNSEGDVTKEFQTAEGVLTVKAFNSEEVKISFKGEGFLGAYRLQKRVPLNFEIDLKYNFISSDARTVQ